MFTFLSSYKWSKISVSCSLSHCIQWMFGLTHEHRRRIMRDCRKHWTASCPSGKWPRYEEEMGGEEGRGHSGCVRTLDLSCVDIVLRFSIDIKSSFFAHRHCWFSCLPLLAVGFVLNNDSYCWLVYLYCVTFAYSLWWDCIYTENWQQHVLYGRSQGSYLEIKKQMDKLDPLAHPLLQWWVDRVCPLLCFNFVSE